MTTIRQAYEAFQAHNDQQEKILASVSKEKAQVSADLNAATEALPRLIAKQFPKLDEMPLANFTVASRLRNLHQERDFDQLVKTMRIEDKLNRKEFARLIAEHGELATVERQLAALQKRADKAAKELETLDRDAKSASVQAGDNVVRRAGLREHEEKYGVGISDKNAALYKEFRTAQWLINKEWRDGRRAVNNYLGLGGKSIDKDIAQHARLKEELEGLMEKRAVLEETHNQIAAEKKELAVVAFRMNGLQDKYMGEKKIHASICASIAQLLQNEEVAKYVSHNLPAEKAEPIMAALVEKKNLQALNDNLETLKIQAEKALSNVSKPLAKLKKAVRHNPSKHIDIDLTNIATQYDRFNATANGYVGTSGNARNVIQSNWTSYGNRNVTVVSGRDDSYSLMDYMLLNMIINDNNNRSNAIPDVGNCGVSSSPSFDMPSMPGPVDIPSMPDMSGCTVNMPSFDVSMPSMDFSVPSIDTSSSSGGGGFDFGSSSSSCDFGSSSGGCDFGSSGGGGDCGGGGWVSKNGPSRTGHKRNKIRQLDRLSA